MKVWCEFRVKEEGFYFINVFFILFLVIDVLNVFEKGNIIFNVNIEFKIR